MGKLPSVKTGATLVEVMLAVVIFSLIILLLFGSFNVALRLTQYSRHVSTATNIAEARIESLRLSGFDNVILSANPTPLSEEDLPGGFSKTYVEYFDGNDRIKQVSVVVYWESRPETNPIIITTLIGQGGING